MMIGIPSWNQRPHGPAKGATALRILSRNRKWVPHEFGKECGLSKQQMREMAEIHESATHNVKHRLSANFGISPEIALTAVSEQSLSSLASSVRKEPYLASLDISPTHSKAILRLDTSVALSIIDLLTGGRGRPAPVQRPLTELEEGVLRILLDMFCEELQAAWRRYTKINFTFDRSHRPADLFRLMPSYEKVLSLSFEVRIADVTGVLTLAFPATVSSLLGRKLAKKNSQPRIESPVSNDLLKGKHLECVFAVEVLLPPTRIKGRDLLSLTAGQTVLIQHPLKEPAVVRVAGRKMFLAYPVRKGGQRGAVIRHKCSISSSDDEVEK